MGSTDTHRNGVKEISLHTFSYQTSDRNQTMTKKRQKEKTIDVLPHTRLDSHLESLKVTCTSLNLAGSKVVTPLEKVTDKSVDYGRLSVASAPEIINGKDSPLTTRHQEDRLKNLRIAEYKVVSKPIDRLCLPPEQYNNVNRRERLLNSTPMQSNFSSMLRFAIKPTMTLRPAVSKSAFDQSSTAKRSTQVLRPRKKVRVGSTPSLRMDNEGSSFTQYVKLNRSANQRLDSANSQHVAWSLH